MTCIAPPRRSERGVTLPEILIVLAIIGLFLVIGLPNVNNYIRAARVRAGNDGIVSDLRLARYIAISNRTTATVTFDASARTWSYTDIHGATVVRTLEMGITFPTLTNTPVTFRSDGSLGTTAPTVVVQGTVTSTLTHQYTITVSSIGKVTSTLARL